MVVASVRFSPRTLDVNLAISFGAKFDFDVVSRIHVSAKGRFLLHRPERSARCLSYEELYQGHGSLPKSQGVPVVVIEEGDVPSC